MKRWLGCSAQTGRYPCRTAGVIVGGSNMAKFMYNQNVMSRKEEQAGKADGGTVAEMRRDAMVKKVRGQREGDIKAVSASMHAVMDASPCWMSGQNVLVLNVCSTCANELLNLCARALKNGAAIMWAIRLRSTSWRRPR